MTRPKMSNVVQVLTAMRDGATLRLHYEKGARNWFLSTGQPVKDVTARCAIEEGDLIGVNDGLFGTCQTWRWADSP